MLSRKVKNFRLNPKSAGKFGGRFTGILIGIVQGSGLGFKG